MLSAREGQTYLSEILLKADEDLFMLGEIMSNTRKTSIMKLTVLFETNY